MKRYCPNCETECLTKIIERNETLTVRGCEITLKVKMRICAECGEGIIDKELDDISLKEFYDEYKKINNLLTATEIKEIRMQWGLSQSQFAILLGMGEKTITRYENGSIQDETHDNLIRLSREIESFKTIWSIRKEKLDKRTQKKVSEILAKRDNVNQFCINALSQKDPYQSVHDLTLFNNWGGMKYASQKYGA